VLRIASSAVALLALALPPIGCTVVDAPETLEELVVFGFEHFDEDASYLEAMGENLFPRVDEHLEELAEGYHVDELDEGHLTAAGVESPDAVSIIGALGAAHYTHGIEGALCGVVYPDKGEIFDNYLAYDMDDDGNLDCFLAGECDRYETTAVQTVEVPVLGEATQTVRRDFRWIRPRGSTPFVVARSLAPEPIEFSTTLMAVDQQYALVIMVPHEAGTRRIETFWVEARVLGMDVPEYFAVTSAVTEMQDQADRIDGWLDEGGGC
jgi:hypothetical protein